MERGLLWLPLLGVFIWLAWAGWNEYQKLEAYRAWAESFEKAKYDIYAVLGQNGESITWGRPTRKGPVNLETFSLSDVRSLQLLVNNNLVDPENPPSQGKVVLEFIFSNSKNIQIPFTDIDLAVNWCKYLQQKLYSA
ncbi:hypothetical protein AFK68_27855 [Hydrocoleum sp. CS-953]|uniref:hypothetical protein n=1 Tax=Hydrocoleum sp. CS-953 TaxID=1671698 RepID=UPI000BC3F076|nr:hypothetical protein [Hydrocoleum sp. CS-953]OZH51910.1 hypothetical protein AFK68_27855 [Hydrocoleum sp. CS-953]